MAQKKGTNDENLQMTKEVVQMRVLTLRVTGFGHVNLDASFGIANTLTLVMRSWPNKVVQI